jgi:hypothetical protein
MFSFFLHSVNREIQASVKGLTEGMPTTQAVNSTLQM